MHDLRDTTSDAAKIKQPLNNATRAFVPGLRETANKLNPYVMASPRLSRLSDSNAVDLPYQAAMTMTTNINALITSTLISVPRCFSRSASAAQLLSQHEAMVLTVDMLIKMPSKYNNASVQ